MTRFNATLLALVAATMTAPQVTAQVGTRGYTDAQIEAARINNRSADSQDDEIVLYENVESDGIIGDVGEGVGTRGNLSRGVDGVAEFGECDGCGENATAYRGVYGYDNPCPAGSTITPFGTCAVN